VKIADLAKHMIYRSGRSINIEFTGLRTGEKTHEVLTSTSELVTPTSHKLVMSSRVKQLALPGPKDISDTDWTKRVQ